MKDYSTWILIMSCIFLSQVMCDYESYRASKLKSQPAYDHDDYKHESATQKQFDLSAYKQISPSPKFTSSHLYASPEAAEPSFTRSASPSTQGYVGGYSAFLEKHFNGDENDDGNEEVNSQYRQQNYDSDDNNGEVNSKYQHVPKDDVEYDHHYHNTYSSSDDHGRRQSELTQKEIAETKQNPKQCKVIVKGKAMCKLCKDPVSGAHSESCSFNSAPPEKKYAYIKKAEYTS